MIVPIEPLVGALRHPFFHCANLARLPSGGERAKNRYRHSDGKMYPSDNDRALLFNTSYLLPLWRSEIQPQVQRSVDRSPALTEHAHAAAHAAGHAAHAAHAAGAASAALL